MNPCPEDGRLRTLMEDLPGDAPDGDVSEGAAAAHVAHCEHCRERLDRMRRDARLAGDAVASLSPGDDAAAVDVEAALAAVRGGSAVGWWQRAAAAAVGLVVVAGLVVTPLGREAVADVLSAFRAERLQVVTLDPATIKDDLETLASLGELRGMPDEPVEVGSLDEAAAVVGFAPAAPADPPAGEPSIAASAPQTVEVTFTTAKTPDLPASLDGAVLRIFVPGVVVQAWGEPPHPASGDTSDALPEVEEAVLVVEAGQLSIDVADGDLGELRAWLLERPELSDDLVAQLEAIGDWRTTLPLPLPVDGVAWDAVTVAGHEGVAFGDESGLGAAVVWEDDGRIRGVGGTVGRAEAQRLAEGLAGR